MTWLRLRHPFAVINSILVVGVLLTLWGPPWWRHRVTPTTADAEDIARTRAALNPIRAANLRALALDWDAWRFTESEQRKIADDLLAGRLRLAGQPPVPMAHMNWWANPFEDPGWRIQLQALVHVRVLVQAWHMTARNEYLAKARDIAVDWMTFEGRWPFGGGYIWNDHAMADRAVTLSLLWNAYATSHLYDSTIGLQIVQSIYKHAGFLGDPRHFTVLTNHGLMQNLALLHISATFPHLSERTAVVDLAIERLTEQYRLLTSPEGIWTEHSPGYHLFAITLLRAATRYLGLLDRPTPPHWSATLVLLERTLLQFARHDGTLPPIGDTVEAPPSGHRWPSALAAALHSSNRADRFLAPCGGYAALWDRRHATPGTHATTSQAILTVAQFPGHGHSRADELSLYLFSNGSTVVTGPGYWPYGLTGRSYATGWTGANAPSYVGEPEVSQRTARLVGHAEAAWGDFLEATRLGPDGFFARREIAWLRPDTLIVVDRVRAPSGRQPVVRWLFSPDLSVQERSLRHWVLTPSLTESATTLDVLVLSETPTGIEVIQGRERPLGGWVYSGTSTRPAPEFEIISEAQGAFVATVFVLSSGHSHAAGSITAALRTIGETWSVTLHRPGTASRRLIRNTDTVALVTAPPAAEVATHIQPVTCDSSVHEAYATLRGSLLAKYGALSARPSVPLSRLRDATLIILGAWLSQESALLIIRRWLPLTARAIRAASCLVLFALILFFALRWGGANVV